MKTFYDVLFEDEEETRGFHQMMKYLDAVRTKAPKPILTLKLHYNNTGEYELYEFLDYCEFYEVRIKRVEDPLWFRTAAVSIHDGKVYFLYDKEFIDKIAKEPGELSFLIAHEASHILRLHIDRTKSKGADPALSNIAQDAVINHDIMQTNEIGGFKPKFIKGGVKLPDEYLKDYNDDKQSIYYERVYDWMYKKQKEQEKKGGKGKNQEPHDYFQEGSIVKVKSGEHEGEYRRVTKKFPDGRVETEPVDIDKIIEGERNK